MGKPQLFSISILNAQLYYLPGSWIEGVVQLRTAESIKARALRLKLDGDEHASWEEHHTTGSGDNRHTTTHHYSKTVEIIDSYLTLWGYPKHTDERTPHITPGSYVFPFCVQIPPVDCLLPSSEFSHGGVGAHFFKAYVRYRIIAYIDIPFATDIEVASPIRVLPRIPLTSIPGWNVAAEQEEIKQVGCCCCFGGEVRVRARCLSSAVMLGGAIMCTGEIINDSSRQVVGVELSLVNCGAFYAGGTTHGSHTVVSADFPVVLQRGEAFSNLSCGAAPGTVAVPKNANTGAYQALAAQPFTLVVPFDAAPQFNGKVITSTYKLVFRVRLEGACVFDIRLNFAPILCTQQTDVPVTAISTPTILNPTGQPRTAVLLLPATKGQYPATFSFDGMDYRPEEQFDTSKQVAYPCFYDASCDTVPASINSYNPTLMHALVAPAASVAGTGQAMNSFAYAVPVGAPMPFGAAVQMPVLAPSGNGFAMPELQGQGSDRFLAPQSPPPPYTDFKS